MNCGEPSLSCCPSLANTSCTGTTGTHRQVENTEVQKWMYGSEKKSSLSVYSALLTHDCSVAKWWLSLNVASAISIDHSLCLSIGNQNLACQETQ